MTVTYPVPDSIARRQDAQLRDDSGKFASYVNLEQISVRPLAHVLNRLEQ